MSLTEMLIVIDNDVLESSMLFNVSKYQTAKAKIATRNGLWTLTDIFLEPRVFKKFSSHDEIIHKKGIANLGGRKLQAAAFYQPPFCYLKSTVNQTVGGIEGEFFIAKKGIKEFELDGVEFKLFMLIAERLNFTWMIRKPNHFFRYGRRIGSTWYGGMIGQIYRKEVDIAFTNIWLTQDYYLFSNLTYPWTQISINFLVPRPKPHRGFWALMKPLTPIVWATILVMVIAQSICIYATAWLRKKVPKRFRNFVATFTELVGRLLGVSSPTRTQGLKLQLQLWHFIGILLVTAYSSNLEARLASEGYEKRIDTLQDFIAANLTWGRQAPAPVFSRYFDESDLYGKQLVDHFEIESNDSERHKKILKGHYAIIGRIIGKMFFPENTIEEEDFKGYRVMKESTGKFYTTFAVQPWLLEPVNKITLRLREAGLAQYHLRDVIHRRTGRELRQVMIEQDIGSGAPRVLKLTPLGAGFAILIFGLTFSTIVFYLELKHASRKTFIPKVLHRMKKKSQRLASLKDYTKVNIRR
nr:ionotropic receptor 1 [Gregopimpla kuwanae]